MPEYDENDLNLIPSPEREIDVYRDGHNGNLKLLLSGDVSPLYFVRCSTFRPGIPDVAIFAGRQEWSGDWRVQLRRLLHLHQSWSWRPSKPQ